MAVGYGVIASCAALSDEAKRRPPRRGMGPARHPRSTLRLRLPGPEPALVFGLQRVVPGPEGRPGTILEQGDQVVQVEVPPGCELADVRDGFFAAAVAEDEQDVPALRGEFVCDVRIVADSVYELVRRFLT